MIGWIELCEERLGVHLRDLIEQNQGAQIGAIDAGVIADRRRAARVEHVAVPEVYFEARVVGEVRVANRDTGIYGAHPGIARQSYTDFAPCRVGCHIVAGRLLIGVVQVHGHRTDGVEVADIWRIQPAGRARAAAKDRRIGVAAGIAVRGERLGLIQRDQGVRLAGSASCIVRRARGMPKTGPR